MHMTVGPLGADDDADRLPFFQFDLRCGYPMIGRRRLLIDRDRALLIAPANQDRCLGGAIRVRVAEELDFVNSVCGNFQTERGGRVLTRAGIMIAVSNVVFQSASM